MPSAGKVQGLGHYEPALHLILDGKHFDARLDGSVTNVSLERTIDGASTLQVTVSDPERFLQGGRYYERRADIALVDPPPAGWTGPALGQADTLWFRMVGVAKQGDLFTLTFEDREVAILRQQTKPRRMSRANATRAKFLQALVAEVPHIGFVSPELNEKQPIAPFSKTDQATLNRSRRGIPLDAHLTIKGARAKRGQIRNLNLALAQADNLGAGHLATMAMIYSGIGESGWRDVMNGNQVPVENWKKDPNGPWAHTSGYGGVLQGAISVYYNGQHFTYFAGMDSPTRTSEQAKSFLQGGRGFQGGGAMKIAKANPGIDPGKIADTVEGAPYSGHYGHQAEAQAIIDAYGGIGSTPSSDVAPGGAYVKSYEFSRGAPAGPRGEDTWACGQRLASEVQWRWYIVAGVVYFQSDADLIKDAPRMRIDEDTPGIDSIDYQVDHSTKIPSTVTVTCQAHLWAAPPGTVVALTEGMGPVAGAWIVSDITRDDITSPQTTITLITTEQPKKEPSSQVVLRSSLPSKDGGLSTSPDTRPSGPSLDPLNSQSLVAKAYRKAQAIDSRHYPYVSGGGHLTAGAPNGGGYDCSGAVSAVLHAAGILLLDPYPPDTPVLAQSLVRWGKPGKGKYMTVWAKDEGGGNGHCFMEFTLPTGTVFFEFHHTGTIGGFESSRDTTGMVPRHWPGT